MRPLHRYRAIFFDVDGTLYYQKRLRIIMCLRLLGYWMLHPGRLHDLKILSTFRRMREDIHTEEGDLLASQYQIVADCLSIPALDVQAVIERWIYQEPLGHLRACRDERLAEIIGQLRARGVITIAYSDYPATAKLAALGIEMDHVFCATDPIINCLKPDPRGLRAIISNLALNPQDCFLVGDRQEKDGLCAQRTGMNCAILPSSAVARARIYRQALFSCADNVSGSSVPA